MKGGGGIPENELYRTLVKGVEYFLVSFVS